ncbi:MAG TPA: peptidase M49, partial [Bacteroidota bacterium]
MKTVSLTSSFLILILMMFSSCGQPQERMYSLERVGPARVVQVYADGFDDLSLNQKVFAYYLSRAALAARDIAIDQHHRYALEMRNILEGIVTHPNGVPGEVSQPILTYTKLFWINNGPYDNITSKKFVIACTPEQLTSAAQQALQNGAGLGLGNESLESKLDRLGPMFLDPAIEPMMTNKTPGEDWIAQSGVNFYEHGLTMKDVEQFIQSGRQKNDLNSKLVRDRGRMTEKIWRAGGHGVEPGMYAADLEASISYMEQAIPYA